MSFTNTLAASFKVELLKAVHDFTAGTGHTFKLALGKNESALMESYDGDTTSYTELVTNNDELVNGYGYTTGGGTLTSVTPTVDNGVAVCDFADLTWTNVSFTTSGGMIYNDSVTGKPACAILSFGGDQQITAGDFQLRFPAAAHNSAVIRIA